MRSIEASAERMSALIQLLSKEGYLGVREMAEALQISTATAARYAEALQSGGWAVWGRRAPFESPRERKLRLSGDWRFHTVVVGPERVQTVSFCPATKKTERQTVMLCDAIPNDEALSAALHRILDTWTESEKRASLLGVMTQPDVRMPTASSLGLHPTQMFDRDTLTQAGLLREYGERSVLYVCYGEHPSFRLFSGGVRMPDLRVPLAWKRAWDEKAESRMDLLAEQTERVLAILTPDVLVLECDGMRGESVAESLRTALAARIGSTDVSIPPVCICEENVAQRELLARLYLRLAEGILRESET